MKDSREWLKEIRLNSNSTMLSLSSKLDISESYYCMLESGERRPSVEIAKKIGEVLNFDWTKFFEEEKQKVI